MRLWRIDQHHVSGVNVDAQVTESAPLLLLLLRPSREWASYNWQATSCTGPTCNAIPSRHVSIQMNVRMVDRARNFYNTRFQTWLHHSQTGINVSCGPAFWMISPSLKMFQIAKHQTFASPRKAQTSWQKPGFYVNLLAGFKSQTAVPSRASSP